MRHYGELSRGAELSSPRQFFPYCAIAMCGYDFREGGGLGGSVCEHPLGFDWKVGSRGIPGQSVGGWKSVGRAVGSMKLGTGPFPRSVAPLNLRVAHFAFRNRVSNSIQTAASKSAQA